MAFDDMFEKLNQIIRLEISKKSNPDFGNILGRTKDKKPKLIGEIKIIEKEREIEVFNKSNMKLLRLTKQCRDILYMCNGINTVEEISQKIYQKKILKRKFLEDLILFLNDLEKEGFIIWK